MYSMKLSFIKQKKRFYASLSFRACRGTVKFPAEYCTFWWNSKYNWISCSQLATKCSLLSSLVFPAKNYRWYKSRPHPATTFAAWSSVCHSAVSICHFGKDLWYKIYYRVAKTFRDFWSRKEGIFALSHPRRFPPRIS